MSGHFYSTKAMLAGVIPPLLHRERRPSTSQGTQHLTADNVSDDRLSFPVEAPATAPRVRLVDYLRKDMQHIHLPHGVPTLPAFAALKVEEAEDKAESECGDADIPNHLPL